MSRRSHHAPARHPHPAGRARRRFGPLAETEPRPAYPVDPLAAPAPDPLPAPAGQDLPRPAAEAPRIPAAPAPAEHPPEGPVASPGRSRRDPAEQAPRPESGDLAGAPTERLVAHHRGPDGGHGTTAPQLRRFIKSRAYVPMHELRRRFGMNGSDDDVIVVDVDSRHRVFVGLPPREGQLLGELLRGGDIGYELSLDPISPVVVGVYPMRPVSRS
jgi:hypothetical protein